MSESPNVKKSLSLSKKLHEDLMSLTDKLGINSHSYIVNEVAKCVARDLMVFNVQNSADNQLSSLVELISKDLKENPND